MSEEITSQIEDAPRGMSTLHAGIRFTLELTGLAGFAIWGWHVGSSGIAGALLAAVFVLTTGAIWAVFGVAGEVGRGKPVVAVPGWFRFALEIAIFGISAYGIWVSWSRAAAETFLTVAALHYAVTWERSRWLLRGMNNQSETREA